MRRSWLVACAYMLMLLVPLGPLFAAEEGGMSLLGVGAAPATSPAVAKTAEAPWLVEFGKSLVEGFTGALPKLVEAFRKNPGGILLAIAEVTALVALFPEIAGVAGTAATLYSLYKAGSDPSKLGEALGDAAFWAVAGAGVGKLFGEAAEGSRLTSAGKHVDELVSRYRLGRVGERVFHGTDLSNAYRVDEPAEATDPELAPGGRLALAWVAPGAAH